MCLKELNAFVQRIFREDHVWVQEQDMFALCKLQPLVIRSRVAGISFISHKDKAWKLRFKVLYASIA